MDAAQIHAILASHIVVKQTAKDQYRVDLPCRYPDGDCVDVKVEHLVTSGLWKVSADGGMSRFQMSGGHMGIPSHRNAVEAILDADGLTCEGGEIVRYGVELAPVVYAVAEASISVASLDVDRLVSECKE